MGTYLWYFVLSNNRTRYENSNIVFSLSKNIIRGCQELDISHLEASFFEDFASGRFSEGLTVFEMPAGTLKCALSQ